MISLYLETTSIKLPLLKIIFTTSSTLKTLDISNIFLGFEIAKFKVGLCINHKKYCFEFISEAGMLVCKPTITPSDPFVKLHADEETLLTNPSYYCSLIGRLIYLTNTSPDITFAVQQLSQYVSSP